MENYRVVTYYVEEPGADPEDYRKEFDETVPANSSEEAVNWVQNHITTEVGGEIVDDLEVYSTGSNEPEVFPR